MRSRSLWGFLAFVLLAPAAASGLTPRLVKDINAIPLNAGSKPSRFLRVGELVYFRATDADTGEELWRSDGTAAGTYRLTDVCPGECSGIFGSIAAAGASYFFLAQDRVFGNGWEPWVSRGTPATTFRLTTTGLPGISSRRWVAGQGLLYFVINAGFEGQQLWRSDGTAAGTYSVSRFPAGAPGSEPGELTELKGRLFFSADDGQRGRSLWTSDGTPQGTGLVRDPLPASADHAGPAFLRVAGNTLYFVAPAPGRGTELWKSDGTTRGTAPLTDLVRGPGSPVWYDLAVINERIYFIAAVGSQGQELWTTDGTARGTRALSNFPRADAFLRSDGELLFLPRTAVGNRIVFAADDGSHGIEPWVSDGTTTSGTRLLRDICPGSCASVFDSGFASASRVFFAGFNPVRGREPWVTDGTPSGTRLLRDLCRGNCDSFPFGFFDAGGRWFFGARPGATAPYDLWVTDGTAVGTARVLDGSYLTDVVFAPLGVALGNAFLFGAKDGEHGQELWRSDGTVATTGLLADLNTWNVGGSTPSELRAVGSSLFFFATDGLNGSGLWKSDGTAEGTSFVGSLTAGGPLDVVVSEAAASQLFLILRPRDGQEPALWRTDGTAAGTLRLTPDELRVLAVKAVGDEAFFVARTEEEGEELWKTDGTLAGTALVVDLEPGFHSSSPQNLTAFQGRLYFTADTSAAGRELWRTDGTAAGTRLVKDIRPQFGGSDPALLTVHQGRLWFFADDGEHGRELWSTVGTVPGTVLAAELAPGPNAFFADQLASDGTRLFISGGDGGVGIGLWVTDGTTAGSRRISAVQLERDPFGDARPTTFHGELYFAAFGPYPISDLLWKSDGTEAGTVAVLDRDGNGVTSPRALRVFGDRLVFTTIDGGLWQSDGTPSGTFKLREVGAPGASGFRDLVPAGSRLFFAGFDRATGTELWELTAE